MVGLSYGAEVLHLGAFLLLALFHPTPLVKLSTGLGRGLRFLRLINNCGLHALEDVNLNVIARVHGTGERETVDVAAVETVGIRARMTR